MFLMIRTRHLLSRCWIREIAEAVVVFSVQRNAKLARNSQNLLKLIESIFSWFKIKCRLLTATFLIILSF